MHHADKGQHRGSESSSECVFQASLLPLLIVHSQNATSGADVAQEQIETRAIELVPDSDQIGPIS